MYWSEALGAAIEVAIAIAGFSGIVAAVGRRGDGDWHRGDQVLLSMLLTASGAALVFAFLPFVVLDAGVDAAVFWRIGSVVQFLWLVGIIVYRRRQAMQAGLTRSIKLFGPMFLLVYLPVMSLLLFNALELGTSWPYVIAVGLSLLTAFNAFVRLLIGSWQPQQ